MQKRMYEQHFNAEQLAFMKASTARDLIEAEEKVIYTTIFLAIVGFMELVMIIAWLFWFNKITAFLMVVGLLFISLVSFLLHVLYKDYKQQIEKVKEIKIVNQ